MAVLGFTLPPDSGEKLSLGEQQHPALGSKNRVVENCVLKKLLSRINDLRIDRLQAGRSIQNATKDPLFILKATHLDCFRRDNSPFADGVSQHGC